MQPQIIGDFDKREFILSKEFEKTVGKVFRTLHPFSEEDIGNLANFYRELWLIKNKNQKLQAKRLELLLILEKQNQKNILAEKQKLIAQLNVLDLIGGSSPFRDSAESI